MSAAEEPEAERTRSRSDIRWLVVVLVVAAGFASLGFLLGGRHGISLGVLSLAWLTLIPGFAFRDRLTAKTHRFISVIGVFMAPVAVLVLIIAP